MANPLVEFNDSQIGIVLGTALHTLGAIAFLGGLIGYLAWHRHLVHQGHHHRKVLEGAAFLTYIAIVVNLLGGFMRTFESGHPHLTEFAESAWVRAVAIKHIFIFAGMGAAVYLFERVAPRLIAAHKAGTLAGTKPAGHPIGVTIVALGILVSAVLGAITQVVPPVMASGDVDDMEDHDVHEVVRYANATGQLTSTPLAPATSSGGFEVLAGTTVLEATFLWAPATNALSADLHGPDGKLVTLSSDNGRAQATLDAPATGSWTYTVRADLAVGVTWELSLRMAAVAAGETLMADQVTIAPGQFFEINTEAEVNATLGWSWTASGPIHYDIHTHFDDEVQYVVDEDGTAGSTGAYTVVRKGGHSYLWENTGTLPVTLDYRVWGRWELDSTFPPS